MARKVDVRWYDTYLQAKEIFESQGPEATLTSVADAMEMKPKSLSRIVNGGRFLDRVHPSAQKKDIQCSYVHLETLERIARFSEQRSRELMPAALANQVSISDLKAELDGLRQDSPLAAHGLNARSNKRIQTKTLFRDVDCFMHTATSDFFGVHKGIIIKANGNSAYQAPSYAILNSKKKLHGLVFCKVGAESRPALDVALDLYDLALARHCAPGSPHIWLIFPEQNGVMKLLAEVALWTGGTPFNGGWLFLAHISDHGKGSSLHVYYESEYGNLLEEITADRGAFTPDKLGWTGVDVSHTGVKIDVPIFQTQLPRGKGRRSYGEVLAETARERMKKRVATKDDKRLLIETDLGV
ncbi:hypothetical protein ACBQ16_11405 [Halopseudomonas bauzanensis]|uniref:hypothetical protein n=1 Tax=Halopseudomonas bauzanensis TaxID=653930 RepID=UPI003523EB13